MVACVHCRRTSRKKKIISSSYEDREQQSTKGGCFKTNDSNSYGAHVMKSETTHFYLIKSAQSVVQAVLCPLWPGKVWVPHQRRGCSPSWSSSCGSARTRSPLPLVWCCCQATDAPQWSGPGSETQRLSVWRDEHLSNQGELERLHLTNFNLYGKHFFSVNSVFPLTVVCINLTPESKKCRCDHLIFMFWKGSDRKSFTELQKMKDNTE